MTRTLKPTFAATSTPAEAPASSMSGGADSGPTTSSRAALVERLAKLTPEQLAAIEHHLDELERGGDANAGALAQRADARAVLLEAVASAGARAPGPPPLEVIATLWWFPPDSAAQPIVIQRVRGLRFNVLQVPEDCRAFGTLHTLGPPLSGFLRADPSLLHRWFTETGQSSRVVGVPPKAFAQSPLPVPPWTRGS